MPLRFGKYRCSYSLVMFSLKACHLKHELSFLVTCLSQVIQLQHHPQNAKSSLQLKNLQCKCIPIFLFMIIHFFITLFLNSSKPILYSLNCEHEYFL